MIGPYAIKVAEREALASACESVGLSPDDAVCLHRHATAIFVLPRHEAVAKIGRGAGRSDQARRSIAMTRWLTDVGFPVTEPLDVPQPVDVDGYVVTFWSYYPQSGVEPPSTADLGHLLRDLHHLPPIALDLPSYRPLRSLAAALDGSSSLPASTRQWLQDRMEYLLLLYNNLDFVLPVGHLHGDAYPGNLLRDRSRVLLGDWDEASVGPRELDLVNTFQGARYGRTPQELHQFSSAYGFDLSSWSGFLVLREIRDLHTLGAFIRRADEGDHDALRQLEHRVATLRRGSRELWTATS